MNFNYKPDAQAGECLVSFYKLCAYVNFYPNSIDNYSHELNHSSKAFHLLMWKLSSYQIDNINTC